MYAVIVVGKGDPPLVRGYRQEEEAWEAFEETCVEEASKYVAAVSLLEVREGLARTLASLMVLEGWMAQLVDAEEGITWDPNDDTSKDTFAFRNYVTQGRLKS